MHSRRVGDLKVVLVLSVYFGVTNSGIVPPVFLSIASYGLSAKRIWLIEPG